MFKGSSASGGCCYSSIERRRADAAVLSVRNINQHQLQHSPTGRTPNASTRPTHLLFIDRLIEALAAYLCRHRSMGLLRLTLDLMRRRLDLFAEIGAVEVVGGARALGAGHRCLVEGIDDG